MDNLDSRIKKELEQETAEIDALLAKEGGMPDMVSAMFKGSMRRWIWVLGFFSLVFFSLTIWSGYHFYLAKTIDDRVFWGVWMIMGAGAVTANKSWSWMEMNRASMMREIKRLELAVAALASSKD